MLVKLKAWHNIYWDWRLGIETVGTRHPPDTTQYHDAQRSGALGYAIAARYIQLLELKCSDVVYDLGCGTGRVLCLLSRQYVARSIGVEFDPGLARTADRNIRSVKGALSPANVLQADAASLDYRDGTVFWLYNSFGAKTLGVVLNNIAENLRVNPRTVRFCYITPEFEEVFTHCGWLKCYRKVKPLLHRSSPASFWRFDPSVHSGTSLGLDASRRRLAVGTDGYNWSH